MLDPSSCRSSQFIRDDGVFANVWVGMDALESISLLAPCEEVSSASGSMYSGVSPVIFISPKLPKSAMLSPMSRVILSSQDGSTRKL